MAKLGVFGGKEYFKRGMIKALNELQLASKIEPIFFGADLSIHTAILSKGCTAIAIFVNDNASQQVIRILNQSGVRLILCMCAGFNMVDLQVAQQLGMVVCRVPSYSPYAVAEYALGLFQSLNRKIHRAFTRSRECNFDIEGLQGMDIHGKTLGVLGTGNIGSVFVKQMVGFGCRILAYDIVQNPEIEGIAQYRSMQEVLSESDAIFLFVPLYPSTYHLLNAGNMRMIKKGAFLINVSRGGLIDSSALLSLLKEEHFGGVGLDVYEGEDKIFYQDMSNKGVIDDKIMRLISWPNVIVSSHMAFFTAEAINNIMTTTLQSMVQFLDEEELSNRVVYNVILHK